LRREIARRAGWAVSGAARFEVSVARCLGVLPLPVVAVLRVVFEDKSRR
jgi:hypothetical protein